MFSLLIVLSFYVVLNSYNLTANIHILGYQTQNQESNYQLHQDVINYCKDKGIKNLEDSTSDKYVGATQECINLAIRNSAFRFNLKELPKGFFNEDLTDSILNSEHRDIYLQDYAKMLGLEKINLAQGVKFKKGDLLLGKEILVFPASKNNVNLAKFGKTFPGGKAMIKEDRVLLELPNRANLINLKDDFCSNICEVRPVQGGTLLFGLNSLRPVGSFWSAGKPTGEILEVRRDGSVKLPPNKRMVLNELTSVGNIGNTDIYLYPSGKKGSKLEGYISFDTLDTNVELPAGQYSAVDFAHKFTKEINGKRVIDFVPRAMFSSSETTPVSATFSNIFSDFDVRAAEYVLYYSSKSQPYAPAFALKNPKTKYTAFIYHLPPDQPQSLVIRSSEPSQTEELGQLFTINPTEGNIRNFGKEIKIFDEEILAEIERETPTSRARRANPFAIEQILKWEKSIAEYNIIQEEQATYERYRDFIIQEEQAAVDSTIRGVIKREE